MTDTRDDAPLGRPHVKAGTEVEVPNNKLKWDKSNPTGHGILFLARGTPGAPYVYCFVQGTGI